MGNEMPTSRLHLDLAELLELDLAHGSRRALAKSLKPLQNR